MDYSQLPDATDLAARLASKAGLSEDQARRFLQAISELKAEDEQSAVWPDPSPTATPFSLMFPQTPSISIPLVAQQDGTMVVDNSRITGWSLLPKPRPVPGQPANPPNKPQKPPRSPGAYPGPSVLFDPLGQGESLGGGYSGPSILVALHDPLGTKLDPSKVNLEGLSGALAKADPGSMSGSYDATVSFSSVKKLGET